MKKFTCCVLPHIASCVFVESHVEGKSGDIRSSLLNRRETRAHMILLLCQFPIHLSLKKGSYPLSLSRVSVSKKARVCDVCVCTSSRQNCKVLSLGPTNDFSKELA